MICGDASVVFTISGELLPTAVSTWIARFVPTAVSGHRKCTLSGDACSSTAVVRRGRRNAELHLASPPRCLSDRRLQPRAGLPLDRNLIVYSIGSVSHGNCPGALAFIIDLRLKPQYCLMRPALNLRRHAYSC